MHNHYTKNLNVKELLAERNPKLIVELGCGGGDNTKQLLAHANVISISTGECPPDLKRRKKLQWINGVSYLEVPNLPEGIEFVSIDTDHNYWTLTQELNALLPKLAAGCMIVMHDTDTYARHDGTQHGYDDAGNTPYPSEIGSSLKKGLQTAIMDFLSENIDFRLYRHTEKSQGATAIIRG